MMESQQDLSPPHVDASRPSLGFPLGTALLLIIIFSLSGVFSCCYHWDKIRALRRFYLNQTDPEDDPEQPPLKPKPDVNKLSSQSLPVLMPGDAIPKFIALPCPCEPPKVERIALPSTVTPEPPPKLPRIAVPLY